MNTKLKKLMQPVSSARPDDRGRITLGALAEGVSRYDVFVDEASGEVLLRPFKEVAAHEAWLYKNPTAQELVAQGLQAAKDRRFGKVKFETPSWMNELEDEE